MGDKDENDGEDTTGPDKSGGRLARLSFEDLESVLVPARLRHVPAVSGMVNRLTDSVSNITGLLSCSLGLEPAPIVQSCSLAGIEGYPPGWGRVRTGPWFSFTVHTTFAQIEYASSHRVVTSVRNCSRQSLRVWVRVQTDHSPNWHAQSGSKPNPCQISVLGCQCI